MRKRSALFFLELTYSDIVLNGVSLDDTYANIDAGHVDVDGFNGDTGSETTYPSLNAISNLVMDQKEINNDPNVKLIAYTHPGQSLELLHFDTVRNTLQMSQPFFLSLVVYRSV